MNVSGVKLTDEQVESLEQYIKVWSTYPADEWGVPAQIAKAVWDALPVEAS